MPPKRETTVHVFDAVRAKRDSNERQASNDSVHKWCMNTHVLRSESTPTPPDYLAVTSLTDDIFLIGLLDKGVTIFSQQVRALNLIWALDHVGRLSTARKIAVVGGGIAGLTAAMALRTIFSLSADSPGRTVTLFEKRSVLCPLQRGCATRWVHPHIYDWPKEGSTNPSAGLPIMNWRAGRASDVAATIVTEWEKGPTHKPVDVEQWQNLRYLKIDHTSREIEWVGEEYKDGATFPEVRGDKQRFDIIILAIGFGSELPESRHRTVPYWRNETYGQPDLLGRRKRYLVSGTGDGGLIDLLRLRIADFREDRIGHELAPEGSGAYKAIQKLRDTYYREPSTQGPELFDPARSLGRELRLIDKIRRRLRADTTASLQIRKGQRVSDAFRGRSSFVNRFLVSILFEVGGFSPEFGDFKGDGPDVFDELIVRHGINAVDHLKDVFSGDISASLADLESKRAQTSIIDQAEGIWDTGWPFNHRTGSGPGSFKRDYVPDATVAVSSAFVSALASVFSARGGNYRATLHRVVTMRADEVHLQQIAHYHGPRPEKSGVVIGRLFKISEAVIGLAASTGRVLITQPLNRSEEECRRLLSEDMKHLGGDRWDPQKMGDEVSALFACPLICRNEDGTDSVKRDKVVAVLFADSTERSAFSEEIVPQIVAACEEFGRYLGRIARNDASELISVKSQAKYYLDNGTSELFEKFSLLKVSEINPPRVPVEYINLEWST